MGGILIMYRRLTTPGALGEERPPGWLGKAKEVLHEVCTGYGEDGAGGLTPVLLSSPKIKLWQ